MNIAVKIIIFLYLLYQSAEDIRKQTLSVRSIVLFSIFAVLMNLFFENTSVLSMVYGFFLGVILLISGKIIRGGLGAGDGMIIASIGLILGGNVTLTITVTAFILSFVVSVTLLILKKVRLKQTMPFVPYILAAYLGVILSG